MKSYFTSLQSISWSLVKFKSSIVRYDKEMRHSVLGRLSPSRGQAAIKMVSEHCSTFYGVVKNPFKLKQKTTQVFIHFPDWGFFKNLETIVMSRCEPTSDELCTNGLW